MAPIPLLIKDDIKRLSAPNQSASRCLSPVNRAFTAVAQEVVGLLKPSHPFQPGSINPTETAICGRPETIMIRAIEPEYRQVIAIEPLTARELEVLQLIVDGHNNPTIAAKLFITKGTVKTHVRNVLRKLCVEDRTQAAIRALRSGLVH
ncbi:helix-turn-helix domain-containing protein [Stenomitos frigidus]|uniref:Helix-turn-helix transcriptional regulator n=1 Tax=Stenomitos frigidus ULC18 TaxID=2107698 RepID=A0A2T1DVD9_9CYAN|nr:helix-turn-helix transcriptional regulator [Stenomitos frigidus ULC18]